MAKYAIGRSRVGRVRRRTWPVGRGDDVHELPSSSKNGKFALDIIDVTAVKLLNEQACLVYDGNRFQWNQQFDQLRNFVTNTVRLEGKWRSPGGRAKRFDGRNFDFSMTWYPD